MLKTMLKTFAPITLAMPLAQAQPHGRYCKAMLLPSRGMFSPSSTVVL